MTPLPPSDADIISGSPLGLCAGKPDWWRRRRRLGRTHDSGEGVDAERDLRDVPALEEVGRLEDLLVRDAVLANRRLEPGQRSPRGLGGHCRATTPSPNAGDPSE